MNRFSVAFRRRIQKVGSSRNGRGTTSRENVSGGIGTGSPTVS